MSNCCSLPLLVQEDYTTDEEALAAHGVKGGAGGILDLLKASKQVAGLDSAALRSVDFIIEDFIKIGVCVTFVFVLDIVSYNLYMLYIIIYFKKYFWGSFC